jgi:hypothetical protein
MKRMSIFKKSKDMIFFEKMIGNKLINVEYKDEYGNDYEGEFPTRAILTFEDNTQFKISYVCYPEGSNWLDIEMIVD